MKRSTVSALGVMLAWTVVALISPLAESAATSVSLPDILTPPGSHQWLGTDELGRSLAARVAIGARYSLLLALVVVVVSFLIGATLGIAAAWLGGWIDVITLRIIDVALAFPGMLLAIALAGLLGPGLDNLAIALVAVGWVGFARIARAQTLSQKQRDYVAVADALGVPALVIARQHILPLIAAPLLVEATFSFAAVVVAEAGLSFLGLGIQAPAPSWGSMIRDGSQFMLIAPYFVAVPGMALMSVVLAVSLLGDHLRDRWSQQSPSR